MGMQSSQLFKGTLTTEALGKRFNNSFELVNYSIKFARDLIMSGHTLKIDCDAKNVAHQVLQAVGSGKLLADLSVPKQVAAPVEEVVEEFEVEEEEEEFDDEEEVDAEEVEEVEPV